MKSFEERLTRLETLSEKLKEGKIPLEEAVSLFEEGMKLARELEKELGRIERKVEILVNEPEKKREATVEPDLQLFPELNEENRE
jgi:exodeoxyribonuclease VII small subunit